MRQPLVTATAETDSEGEALLGVPHLPDERPMGAIWDLLQILSYLTGRRVMLPSDAGRYVLPRVSAPVVEEFELHRAAWVAWEHRPNLVPPERRTAFLLYLQAVDSVEAEVRAAMGSVALENAVRDIGAQAPPEPDEPVAEDLRDELRAVVDARTDLSSARKSRFRQKVEDWGAPGLGPLVRRYVVHYGLSNLPDGSDAKKRANHVAEMRNGLLHTGQLREPTWINRDDEDEQILHRKGATMFYGAQLIPGLVQRHLDHLWGIEGFARPRGNANWLSEYFEHGTYDGQSVEGGSPLSDAPP
ncbi:hypothetical protein BSZ37_21180 [Rubrivirga marina]|uniref:Apea-like HEPN domain-containing protein n=2 Tax=Rubrivirga marina TaxID=1196024 RepID=A0A271IUD1_9BACT|nr:hypothetical protein BSZ37_21180 [Rubrivirga marina]